MDIQKKTILAILAPSMLAVFVFVIFVNAQLSSLVLNAGNMQEQELLQLSRNIRIFLFSLSALILFSLIISGHVIGLRLSEKSKQLEIELQRRKQAEEHLGAIFIHAPSAMLKVNSEGEIKMANQRAASLLGYDIQELERMSVEQLIPIKHRDNHRQHRRSYLSVPETRAMGAGRELTILHKDGHEIPVDLGLTPIRVNNQIEVITGIRNLTFEQNASRLLKQRALELERSNKDLDEFAYVASHDLKAPLRGINQLAAFIEKDSGHLLTEDSRQDLALIRSRIDRMDYLLDSLLQYSRLGRDESAPEMIDTAALLKQLVDLYIPKERFDVRTVNELPEIYIPRVALSVVLRNILMNAVKHHDCEHGTITISSYMDEQYCHILIADDGPGIADKYRDKIFQMFQTLKPRDEFESSGMGLALVKRTIENHGGKVELIPGEGRGASFKIQIPMNKQTRQVAA